MITDGRIELTLRATDKGTPRLNSTASLVVTVLDTNDNSPVFSDESNFDISIKEVFN